MYHTFDTFELLLRDSGDHQILRHSRIESEFKGVYPRIGGVSGTEIINCVVLLLKYPCSLWLWNAVPHPWKPHAKRIFIG